MKQAQGTLVGGQRHAAPGAQRGGLMKCEVGVEALALPPIVSFNRLLRAGTGVLRKCRRAVPALGMLKARPGTGLLLYVLLDDEFDSRSE
jgi:hypothetical protein